MKAVQLNAYNGVESLKVVETDLPKSGADEILIQVKATGINFAELELTKGRYQVAQAPPFIMGFEAAGVVAAVGERVSNHRVGDRVTSVVSSGGYAEFATADAQAAIPIPDGLSFAEATTIPIQGLTAYCLLTYSARLQPEDTVLIQAAAGGVGLYLVQLAKLMRVKKVIALVSSREKMALVESLGANLAIDYSQPDWPDRVREATDAAGVDVVLEAASGDVGAESFKLLASFGRMVMFGARNIHDTLSPESIRQLIYKNQSVTGFNFPSLRPQQIRAAVAPLMQRIAEKKVKIFAESSFPLTEVRTAFAALASRGTIGKVVLTP